MVSGRLFPSLFDVFRVQFALPELDKQSGAWQVAGTIDNWTVWLHDDAFVNELEAREAHVSYQLVIPSGFVVPTVTFCEASIEGGANKGIRRPAEIGSKHVVSIFTFQTCFLFGDFSVCYPL